jgi:prepilin-type N-terminal cleavage/methylation domain-containing protein
MQTFKEGNKKIVFRSLVQNNILLARASESDGFSLLELTAVVVVLGVLSSITIPRIGDIIANGKIDQAKSLLNIAAADCLQNYRIDPNNADDIDATIISNEKLKSTGYSIDSSKNKCSNFEIVPLNSNDSVRFPFGFSVINGQLIKRATPTSATSIKACESWAGIDCVQGSGLSDHIELLKQIEAAKSRCNVNYNNWLKGGTKTASFKKWNPKADSRCPTRPPITDTSTCNAQGCNPGLTVWGLDGEFVGFERTDYERALEKKYGKACTDWVAKKKLTNYTNNPQNIPATLKECVGQEFWFYKGVDVGSKAEFDRRICGENLEREKQTPGKRTVQGCGDQIYYFSEGKIHDSEREYKESSCKVDKYNKAQEGIDGAFTTNETGAEGCGAYWICEKKILDSEEKYEQSCGGNAKAPACERPHPLCNRGEYWWHHMCKEYSNCLGRSK